MNFSFIWFQQHFLTYLISWNISSEVRLKCSFVPLAFIMMPITNVSMPCFYKYWYYCVNFSIKTNVLINAHFSMKMFLCRCFYTSVSIPFSRPSSRGAGEDVGVTKFANGSVARNPWQIELPSVFRITNVVLC